MTSRLIILIVVGMAVTSCFIRSKSAARNSEPFEPSESASADAFPDLDKAGDKDDSLPRPSPDTARKVQPGGSATIFAVNDNTYRFLVGEERVWDALVNALLKNYNLNLVDRESGLITTEWDSYYLNQTLYRNKISLRMVKTGRNSCELIIRNKVEQITDQGTASVSGVWLPAKSGPEEPYRLVRNVALMLNQPPPVAPTSEIAKDLNGGRDAY